ncbi:MAG: hypothetical protein WBS54_12425, partial [Acidobacteriota bacterium]
HRYPRLQRHVAEQLRLILVRSPHRHLHQPISMISYGCYGDNGFFNILLSLTVTVVNNSGHSLVVLGGSIAQGMHFTGTLYTSQGAKIACGQESASWVTGPSAPSTWPKCEFPSGGVLTVSSGIYNQERCPLTEVPPGQYEGRITVTAQTLVSNEVRLLSSELRIPVEVRQPTGQDAAYLEALQNALHQYEVQANPVKLRGVPLSWHEVLSSFRIHPAQIALSRFPTSSYAGYALAQEVPDYSNPLFKPVPPADQVRRSRDEGKTVVAFPDKKFEAYFLHLDRFMQGGRVPESLRATLYGFYGDLLVQRGRFPEAEAAFQEAVKSKPSGGRALAYYERAKGFLSALQKK